MSFAKSIVGAGAALGVVALGAASAAAAPLTVTSYSMINGGTGTYNYRDFTYSNCPANDCDTTSAPLSGGVGKLTDGVSPALNWYSYGQNTPWVGWYVGYPNETDPTVTFNFNGVKKINSVTVWVDNSLGAGGVNLPASVSIDGTNFAIAPDNSNPAPRAYTFSNLGLTGSSADVQFFQSNVWIMVGEVSFDGSNAIPEPGVWALLLAGFGLTGASLRRRRAAVAG